MMDLIESLDYFFDLFTVSLYRTVCVAKYFEYSNELWRGLLWSSRPLER